MSYGKKHQGAKHGTSMSGLEVSPERRKRNAKKRKRQEELWAAKAGPVKSYPDPSVIKPSRGEVSVTARSRIE